MMELLTLAQDSATLLMDSKVVVGQVKIDLVV
jgi:hypothetical protein